MISRLGDRALEFLLRRDDLLYVNTRKFYLLLLPALLAYMVMRIADLVDNYNIKNRG